MAEAARPVAGRKLVLTMLLIVYAFNFLDRQILSILAEPVKADLNLTDSQLGMLGGFAIALLYSTLAIPFALIADRTSRSWVVTASLVVWSGFTMLCGTATNFVQMFLYRLGVGVGEAGGVAPSYALISDSFPPRQRARAFAIYSLGVPLGGAIGAVLGGYLADKLAWQTVFLLVGALGILVAIPFKLIVRDRPRPATTLADVEPPTRVFAILAAKPSFWLMSFGAAAASMCGHGVAFWLPALLMRSFGLDIAQTGQILGLLLMTSGVTGILLGGWIGDRLGSRDVRYYALIPAVCFIVGAPLFLAGVLSSSWQLTLLLLALPQALFFVWPGPVLNAIQHLVPAQMRATASASFMLINNLIGIGLGIWTIGAISDAFEPMFGAQALRYAIALALALNLVAGALMALAARKLKRDWVAD